MEVEPVVRCQFQNAPTLRHIIELDFTGYDLGSPDCRDRVLLAVPVLDTPDEELTRLRQVVTPALRTPALDARHIREPVADFVPSDLVRLTITETAREVAKPTPKILHSVICQFARFLFLQVILDKHIYRGQGGEADHMLQYILRCLSQGPTVR